LAGHGASITAEALRWTAREEVTLYLMNLAGECLSVLGESVDIDHRRKALSHRQKQFAAALDPKKRIDIAHKIVDAKLRTLGLHHEDAQDFRDQLYRARKLDDILVVEGRAGAAYFMRHRGTELRFRDLVPDHWRVFAARAGSLIKGRGGVSRARHAATPIGAMLNYSYTVALGQCTRAVIGAGLDPCHGFLHSPKPGRLSLAYDTIELHRTALTESVLAYAAKREFRCEDFEMDKHGVVRLSGPIARNIAVLALRVAPIANCSRTVKKIMAWF
jgi:CRISPR-associated protein Cas1